MDDPAPVGDFTYPQIEQEFRLLNEIKTPPFYATRVTYNSYQLFQTFGGLKNDKQAQVLDVEGSPIANLFAAGEAANGQMIGARLIRSPAWLPPVPISMEGCRPERRRQCEGRIGGAVEHVSAFRLVAKGDEADSCFARSHPGFLQAFACHAVRCCRSAPLLLRSLPKAERPLSGHETSCRRNLAYSWTRASIAAA